MIKFGIRQSFDEAGKIEERYANLDEKNPFVELLWEKGALHEKKIISEVGLFVDLSGGTIKERIDKTLAEFPSMGAEIYKISLTLQNS